MKQELRVSTQGTVFCNKEMFWKTRKERWEGSGYSNLNIFQRTHKMWIFLPYHQIRSLFNWYLFVFEIKKSRPYTVELWNSSRTFVLSLDYIGQCLGKARIYFWYFENFNQITGHLLLWFINSSLAIFWIKDSLFDKTIKVIKCIFATNLALGLIWHFSFAVDMFKKIHGVKWSLFKNTTPPYVYFTTYF